MKNKPYPLNNVPQINNLKEMVIYCAKTYKDSTVFQFKQNNEIIKISFQKFLDDINSLGTAFNNCGLKNEKIALIAENSYEWILSYFAVISGGNVIVPIDPEMSNAQMKQIIDKTKISTIICSEKYFEKIQNVSNDFSIQQIIVLETDIPAFITEGKALIYEGEKFFIDYNINNNECNVIIYTSRNNKPTQRSYAIT